MPSLLVMLRGLEQKLHIPDAQRIKAPVPQHPH
jgi:hypothetical protein